MPWVAAGVAITGWTALGLQLVLTVGLTESRGGTVTDALVIYFSYFTILTNVLAACTVTWPIVSPDSSLGAFFRRPTVTTGVAVSMLIVGIVYSAMLRRIWDPQGLQLLTDRLLHDVMPVAFLGYWWLAVPARSVHVTDTPRWLIYPAMYLVFALGRGAVTHVYPYAFINAAMLGYPRVALNALLIGFVVAVISVALVLATRLKRVP